MRGEPKKPNAQSLRVWLSIRILVLLYLSWLLYQLIQMYLEGSSTVGPGVELFFLAFFFAAIVLIAVFTYLGWKKRTRKMTEQSLLEKKTGSDQDV